MRRSTWTIESGLVSLFEELESLGEVAGRLIGGERRARGLGRLVRVVERLGTHRGWGGLEPVLGELSRSGSGAPFTNLLQRLGHRSVRHGQASGAEVLDQSVLDESVGEAVATRRILELAHEGDRLGLLTDLDQFVLWRTCRVGQEVDIKVSADDRGHREGPLGAWSEPPDSGSDHLPHALG